MQWQKQSPKPLYNGPSTDFPLSICVFYCTILVYFFWHISLLHFSHVAPFLVLLHVALTSCCTFFVLDSFRVALFPCCNFHIALFSSFTFLCCTLFVLHFSVLQFFHVALFLSSTFSELYSFRVALFSCSTFFHVALFSCRTFFRVALLSCCTFCALFSCCTFFHVVNFLSCTFFVLNRFHVAPFVCCTPFMLHLFSCCLTLLSVHAARFRHSDQQLYQKRLHHRYFPMKFVKFSKTPILENICERLLQKVFSKTLSMSKSHNIVISQRMNGLI